MYCICVLYDKARHRVSGEIIIVMNFPLCVHCVRVHLNKSLTNSKEKLYLMYIVIQM